MIGDLSDLPFKIPRQTLRPNQKLVLQALMICGDVYAENCYASQSTLAKLVGVSKPTVSRSLKKLEDLNLIIRKELSPFNTVNYSVDVDQLKKLAFET